MVKVNAEIIFVDRGLVPVPIVIVNGVVVVVGSYADVPNGLVRVTLLEDDAQVAVAKRPPSLFDREHAPSGIVMSVGKSILIFDCAVRMVGALNLRMYDDVYYTSDMDGLAEMLVMVPGLREAAL